MLEIMKRVAIFALGIALCLMDFLCAADVTTATPVLKATYGTTVNMQWKITLDENQTINSFSVSLKSQPRNPIISGGADSQIVLNKGRELFGSRVSAVYDEIASTYTVSLKNIQYNETLSIQLTATLNNPFFGKQELIEIKEVTGSPSLCGKNLESKYMVNETRTLSVVQVICGHPKPEVKWKVGDDNFSASYNSSEINTKIRQYGYTFRTRTVNRTDCGKDIKYIANNSFGIKTGSATIDVTFKPKVLYGSAYINNTGCILVSWYRENTGKCNISYHLQFAGRETIYNTSNTYFTLCNATDVKTVTIRASYKGNVGKEVTRRISTTTSPPTTTTTTPSKTTSITPSNKTNGTVNTNGGDKKSNIGLIVGIVGGILFVIIIIIIIVCVLKNKKKNGTGNHSGYAMRVTGEENNYVTDPTRSNRRQPANPDDPEQAIYSELGPGGGRTGPRPAPEQSDYAEMKVDAMGYPIEGAKASEPPTYAPVIKPREGAKRRTPSPPRSNVDGARAAASSEPPAYAPIMKNRSSSRGRSPPPDEDDHEGVIV
uniref:Allorecognition 1 n=1 Tax=Hydractinia symbiolongicarpus TaxID=13093 RepID=D9ZHT4_HYDSY|nr:allorecognition 1 [Hydractinia symbiolongicarpus]